MLLQMNMIDQVTLLRNLIHERTGLFFRDYHGVEFLEARLKPRLEKSGCASFTEYHGLLSGEKDTAAGEWLVVIAELTKPVSNFRRHTKRAQALADTVIPEWLSNSDKKRLKIWSAGCATGEEPLSIAIALSDAGWFDRLSDGGIEIHASDASSAALAATQQGVYNEGKMIGFSGELRGKYFDPAEDGWKVKPALHKRIQWSMANLVNENEVAELASSDIIFCRNVFIYFSEQAICRTLSLFAERMPLGGYLFTDGGDYFESLMSRIEVFHKREFNGEPVWIKTSTPVHS